VDPFVVLILNEALFVENANLVNRIRDLSPLTLLDYKIPSSVAASLIHSTNLKLVQLFIFNTSCAECRLKMRKAAIAAGKWDLVENDGEQSSMMVLSRAVSLTNFLLDSALISGKPFLLLSLDFTKCLWSSVNVANFDVADRIFPQYLDDRRRRKFFERKDEKDLEFLARTGNLDAFTWLIETKGFKVTLTGKEYLYSILSTNIDLIKYLNAQNHLSNPTRTSIFLFAMQTNSIPVLDYFLSLFDVFPSFTEAEVPWEGKPIKAEIWKYSFGRGLSNVTPPMVHSTLAATKSLSEFKRVYELFIENGLEWQRFSFEALRRIIRSRNPYYLEAVSKKVSFRSLHWIDAVNSRFTMKLFISQGVPFPPLSDSVLKQLTNDNLKFLVEHGALKITRK
jgi:hypothetical protein